MIEAESETEAVGSILKGGEAYYSAEVEEGSSMEEIQGILEINGEPFSREQSDALLEDIL